MIALTVLALIALLTAWVGGCFKFMFWLDSKYDLDYAAPLIGFTLIFGVPLALFAEFLSEVMS